MAAALEQTPHRLSRPVETRSATKRKGAAPLVWGGVVLQMNEKEVQKCKQKRVILLGFWEINTTAYHVVQQEAHQLTT